MQQDMQEAVDGASGGCFLKQLQAWDQHVAAQQSAPEPAEPLSPAQRIKSSRHMEQRIRLSAELKQLSGRHHVPHQHVRSSVGLSPLKEVVDPADRVAMLSDEEVDERLEE